jgi:hypothetical protein
MNSFLNSYIRIRREIRTFKTILCDPCLQALPEAILLYDENFMKFIKFFTQENLNISQNSEGRVIK